MTALYNPGSVSYYRDLSTWDEVTQLWPNAPKPDSFMLIQQAPMHDDLTSVLIAAFTLNTEEFRTNW
jgi:hypothetical protein